MCPKNLLILVTPNPTDMITRSKYEKALEIIKEFESQPEYHLTNVKYGDSVMLMVEYKTKKYILTKGKIYKVVKREDYSDKYWIYILDDLNNLYSISRVNVKHKWKIVL